MYIGSLTLLRLPLLSLSPYLLISFGEGEEIRRSPLSPALQEAPKKREEDQVGRHGRILVS